MRFKEWIQLFEQPHLYAEEPLNFRLHGIYYNNIISIDPRIERWPNQEDKLRFGRYAVGFQGKPPQDFYFVDDTGKVFVIKMGTQNLIQQSFAKPPKELVMPNYWHRYAQFRTASDEFIDNLEPSLSKTA